MSDVLIIDKNEKDKTVSVNALNELLYIVKDEKTDIIYKNISTDFDVVAGENGVISILAVGLSGSLLLFKFLHNEWKKYVVLDSRSGNKKINAVKTIEINGRIHAFYCIAYDGRMMLIHHILESCDFSIEPHVIYYIGLRCAYTVCTDDSMNIYIMYSDENSNLKYAVFSNSQKRYSVSSVICNEEVRSINSIFSDNTVCMAYLSREHEYNVINCIRADTREKHTIGFGVDSLSEPCIFTDGLKIYVQWCERNNSFESSAETDFKFSKPISIGRNANILRIRNFENNYSEKLNKCVSNKRGILASAEKICMNFKEKKEPVFEIKGSQVEKFAQKNSNFFDEKYKKEIFERQLYDLERRIEEMEKYVCELSMKNTDSSLITDLTHVSDTGNDVFKKIDVAEMSSDNSDNSEYNGSVNNEMEDNA